MLYEVITGRRLPELARRDGRRGAGAARGSLGASLTGRALAHDLPAPVGLAAGGAVGLLLLVADPDVLAVLAAVRITSYNVCYTKLLRSTDAGLHLWQ